MGNSKKNNGVISDQKKTLRKNNLLFGLALLMIGIVIGFVLACYDLYKANPVKRSASTTIEFTYNGAALNQMPNGQPFTIEGIKKAEVVEAALKNIGLSGKYNTEDVRASIRVKGYFPGDIMERLVSYESVYNLISEHGVKKDNVYTTAYEVTLFDTFDPSVSSGDLKKLLTGIVSQYEKYFRANYVYPVNDDSENRVSFMESVDYRQQIDVLRNRLKTIDEYAAFLFNEDANFIHNGMNFNDICVRCRDVENNNLSNLEATVMMKVYSKNPERLSNMYQYRINLLNTNVKRVTENLAEIDALIDNYEMDDILYVGMGGDSVVTIESHSVETYESLITQKIELTSRLTSLNSEIDIYKGDIEDLSKEKATAAETEAVEKEMTSIVSKLTGIEAAMEEMIKAFNEYRLGDDEIIIGETQYKVPSIFSFGFFVRFCKLAFPVFMLMFVVFGMKQVADQKKLFEEKMARNKEINTDHA